VQHEAIHHRQWSFYAAQGGFAVPDLWRVQWGLEAGDVWYEALHRMTHPGDALGLSTTCFASGSMHMVLRPSADRPPTVRRPLAEHGGSP
jgi:hypothetical protein